jgi:hypothetical protein
MAVLNTKKADPATIWVICAMMALALVGIGIRFKEPQIAMYLWLTALTIGGVYAFGKALWYRIRAHRSPKTVEQAEAEAAADAAAAKAAQTPKQKHQRSEKPRGSQARKPKNN